MRRMASRCAGLARSSTIGTAWPCPSWIGPGHENTPANISPSSLVPPWLPSSITIPTTASQLPWVGRALNWQGQPYVPFRLDQHIEDLALGVDGAPQIDHAAIDF